MNGSSKGGWVKGSKEGGRRRKTRGTRPQGLQFLFFVLREGKGCELFRGDTSINSWGRVVME